LSQGHGNVKQNNLFNLMKGSIREAEVGDDTLLAMTSNGRYCFLSVGVVKIT